MAAMAEGESGIQQIGEQLLMTKNSKNKSEKLPPPPAIQGTKLLTKPASACDDAFIFQSIYIYL